MWTSRENYNYVFKGMPKNYNLSEKINVNIASGPKLQNVFFFNTIQPVSLNIISHGQLLALTLWNHWKIWNLRLKKKKDINFNVCFCQRNTTKINIDTIVNVANETLVVGKH